MSDARLVITILAVTDLERAKRFYESAFGWELRIDVPVFAQYAVPDGPDVALYQRESFGANTGRVPPEVPEDGISGTELYFWTEDLPAAVERLEASGARLLAAAEPKPWGDLAAYFADPDGNVIAVATEA
jgi:predicted enzyme related to lactoylglutathione lyase